MGIKKGREEKIKRKEGYVAIFLPFLPFFRHHSPFFLSFWKEKKKKRLSSSCYSSSFLAANRVSS